MLQYVWQATERSADIYVDIFVLIMQTPHDAQVVFGPVPRRLAALPLTVADGSLIAAATFVGKVGAPQPG
jgi:hypothetical protein